MAKIGANSWVTLGSAVMVCVFLVVQSYYIGEWKSKINENMKPLPQLIERVYHIESDVDIIKSNRFIDADSAKLYKELKDLWMQISSIKQDIAAMPNEIPPQWFMKQVEELSKQVRANGESIKRIEAKI